MKIWVRRCAAAWVASVVPQTVFAQSTADFAPFLFVEGAPEVVALNGEIDLRTPLAFKRALAAHPNAHTVVLNSVGGSVQAGLLVAEEIHERGMNTLILRDFQCMSACSFLFFAGKERLAEGQLGVHQISGDADLETAQLNLSDVLETLTKFGVSPDVITRMLRTPPGEMYVFKQQELSALGINRMSNATSGSGTAYVPPTVSQPAATADLSDQIEMAKAFVLGVIVSGSAPANELVGLAGNSYSEQVDFYGKLMSKSDVLMDKRSYAERWPSRTSSARPSTIQVYCSGNICRVTGIYDWSVSNEIKRKSLKGSATFEYTVDMSGGDYRIIGENGKVLERR